MYSHVVYSEDKDTAMFVGYKRNYLQVQKRQHVVYLKVFYPNESLVRKRSLPLLNATASPSLP